MSLSKHFANIRNLFEIKKFLETFFEFVPKIVGRVDEKQYLCTNRSRTMLEDNIFEDEILDDELEQVWLVAEVPSRDIAEQLADLHTLKGAAFISMLKEITQNSAFSSLEGESNIYVTGVIKDHDFDDQLNAAHKAVEHGYTVYMLPNPKGFRTADFIFVRKGVYKMFDLKTIHGTSIVGGKIHKKEKELLCSSYFKVSDAGSRVHTAFGFQVSGYKWRFQMCTLAMSLIGVEYERGDGVIIKLSILNIIYYIIFY